MSILPNSITRRCDSNWDYSFGKGIANFATGSEACAQNVKARCQLVLGEWFLDTSAGLYNPDLMGKKPANMPYLESITKACILKTVGVKNIISFGLVWNSQTRQLVMDVSLNTIYGTTENIQVRRS